MIEPRQNTHSATGVDAMTSREVAGTEIDFRIASKSYDLERFSVVHAEAHRSGTFYPLQFPFSDSHTPNTDHASQLLSRDMTLISLAGLCGMWSRLQLRRIKGSEFLNVLVSEQPIGGLRNGTAKQINFLVV